MIKKLTLTLFILILSYNNANSFSHDKLKKGLKDLEKGITKELNKSNQSLDSKKKSSDSKKKQVQGQSKVSKAKVEKIEALDQKISDSNQVLLIYCKISAERKWTQDYSFRKKKKGQIDKLDYIIFDNNQDLKECSSYKPQKGRYWETKILSSAAVSAKEYENYWLSRIIKSNKNKQFPLPFGQKVKIKLPRTDNPRSNIEIETVLKKSDLIRYCIGGNSQNYNLNRKSIYSVFFSTDVRNNKLIKGYCRSSSGNMKDYGFEIIPVSKGKFSRDDIKNFRFNTIAEIKTNIENKNKAKKEAEIAKKESERKKREYNNSPEGILLSSYQNYMLIKGFYESRKQYPVKYVTPQQFSTSKSQIKAIENAITKKNKVDSDKVWNKASEWYKKNWASTMELYKSTGTYTQQAAGTVKIYLMSLNSTYNKVVKGGASAPKKDF